MTMHSRLWLVILIAAPALLPQQPQAGQSQQPQTPATPTAEARGPELRPNYTLGPNDQVMVRVSGVEETSDRPYRVDDAGNVTLPLVGKVRVEGLTLEQLEAELAKQFRVFVVNPQVIVTLVQLRSEPIFATGAFRSPGIYPLQGRRTLVETLTAIGGLQPNASRRVKITRRMENGAIPLPNAVVDEVAQTSSVEINLTRLLETSNAIEDITLQPFDIVAATKAEMVYIAGEVARPGGFELNDTNSISVLQVLSLAGGVTQFADVKKARVLRRIQDTSKRAEISIKIKDIAEGTANDFPLMQDDVLVIPRQGQAKSLLTQMGIVAVPTVITAILTSAIISGN